MSTHNPQAGGDDENEDEEQIDLKHIQSFADKVQLSGESRPQISLPKRGEKDFEPLAETVNLQEMMLQRSREALFGALQGVRGGASKSISQAVLTPNSHYPSVLVTRGHLLDTMGNSIRESNALDPKGKTRARTQLLPEEALFLLERGSLQIWTGQGEWDEETWSVRGAVEMSVAEAFATFLDKDGLSWERYQAYAVLKRLGYTVQRSARFIPEHFTPRVGRPALAFRSWWTRIPSWISSLVHRLCGIWRNSAPVMLSAWRGTTFASLFASLRTTPAGHLNPLPSRSSVTNPYLPFFHVWKPAYPWTKQKWDRGSSEGLITQPPNFYVAAIDARTVPLPSIHQLHEVFEELPDEPRGPPRRTGPQYKQVDPTRPFRPNPFAELRNGDRALVVAVNDSGNTGWVRFGRSGFVEHIMI